MSKHWISLWEAAEMAVWPETAELAAIEAVEESLDLSLCVVRLLGG